MLTLATEAVGFMLAGMAALVTAATTMIVQLVGLKRGQTKQDRQIEQVHVLVNSQLTDVTNRVTQLEATLIAAGITVPADPANPTRPSGGN